jgi:propanediol dehydratase small subunit
MINRPPLTSSDYPVSENRPELVRTSSGKPLDAVTLDAVVDGTITMADLRITGEALLIQAEIARSVGRETLARNFERAAELVDVPQELILEAYELLRPGRANDKQKLMNIASRLRAEHGARRVAEFLEEAADVYERRRLFTYRF